MLHRAALAAPTLYRGSLGDVSIAHDGVWGVAGDADCVPCRGLNGFAATVSGPSRTRAARGTGAGDAVLRPSIATRSESVMALALPWKSDGFAFVPAGASLPDTVHSLKLGADPAPGWCCSPSSPAGTAPCTGDGSATPATAGVEGRLPPWENSGGGPAGAVSASRCSPAPRAGDDATCPRLVGRSRVACAAAPAAVKPAGLLRKPSCPSAAADLLWSWPSNWSVPVCGVWRSRACCASVGALALPLSRLRSCLVCRWARLGVRAVRLEPESFGVRTYDRAAGIVTVGGGTSGVFFR